MNKVMRDCIVVGSSRGLGAALVEEFLRNTDLNIIGIARTKPEDIAGCESWFSTGRYRHITADIGSAHCIEILTPMISALTKAPACIIFNAAHIEKDVRCDGSIDYQVFHEINRVGISGLGNVLSAVEPHLLQYGGTFAGISSFWGSVPPLSQPWLSYCASKAYLNMALTCLRPAWRGSVDVVAINIGNIKDPAKSGMPEWIVPAYSSAAKKLVGSLMKAKVPRVINYPFSHFLVYRGFLRFVPGFVYAGAADIYLKVLASKSRVDGRG